MFVLKFWCHVTFREAPFGFEPYMLQCQKSHFCVHPDNICDGIRDCVDGEDEALCSKTECPLVLVLAIQPIAHLLVQ